MRSRRSGSRAAETKLGLMFKIIAPFKLKPGGNVNSDFKKGRNLQKKKQDQQPGQSPKERPWESPQKKNHDNTMICVT